MRRQGLRRSAEGCIPLPAHFFLHLTGQKTTVLRSLTGPLISTNVPGDSQIQIPLNRGYQELSCNTLVPHRNSHPKSQSQEMKGG